MTDLYVGFFEDGYLYGIMVTPDGLKGVYTNKFPDNFVFCAVVDVKKDMEYISSLGIVFYDVPATLPWDPETHHVVCVVRYTDEKSLVRMLGFLYGYPCSVVKKVGGYCNYKRGMCWYNGYAFLCSGGFITFNPKDFSCISFLKYCLLQTEDRGVVECRDGKIYYHGKEVELKLEFPNIDYFRMLRDGILDPEEAIDYNNIFHFLCTYAKNGCCKYASL